MAPTRLLVIRHGERADLVSETNWRQTRYTQPRPYDPPLTVRGHEEASQAALGLRYLPLSAKVIYCSPLRRCLETAAVIASALSLPVKVVVALAKPCSYFRKCYAARRDPQYADKDEALRILHQTDPDLKLVGFDDQDITGREALELICLQATSDQALALTPQAIVISHCETQREMARAAGVTERFPVPYCGVASFDVKHTDFRSFQWTLVGRPVHPGYTPASPREFSITGSRARASGN